MELENTESLAITAKLDDQVTGPGVAVATALNKVADGAERMTETLTRKATPGIVATRNAVEPLSGLLDKQAQIIERYNARVATLQRAGGDADKLAEDIRRLGILRDQDLEKARAAATAREQMFNGGKVDAYAQALSRAAVVGKNLQDVMQNGLSANAFNAASAGITRTAQELSDLRAEVDSVYRVSRDYEKALNSLGEAADVLGIRGKALENIMQELNNAYTRQLQPMREVNAEAARMAAERDKQAKASRDLQNAYNQERAALDPLFALELRHQQQLSRIGDLQNRGLNPARAQNLTTMATASYEAEAARIKEAAGQVDANGKRIGLSLGQQRQQMINFGQQVQDAFVQISSGSGLFYPLVQQVPQAVSALGGMSDAWAKLKGFVLSGTGAFTIATAAFAGFAYMANSRIGDLNGLSVRLRGVGDDAMQMAKNVEEAGKRAARNTPGVSAAEGVGMVEGFVTAARTNRLRGDVDTVALVRDTADIAARVGQSVTDVFGQIKGGMADPLAMLDQFVKQGLLPLDASFRSSVEAVRASGNTWAAFVSVMDRARLSAAGAAEQGLSPLGKAMLEFKREFGSFWDDFGRDLESFATRLIRMVSETRAAARLSAMADPDYRENENLIMRIARRRTREASGGPDLPNTGIRNAALLDAIQVTEGGRNSDTAFNTFLGQNSVGGRTWTNPNPVVNGLEEKTMREVIEMGRALRAQQAAIGIPENKTSSAAGAFQITGSTMEEFARRLGMSLDEKFSRENQRRLAQGIVDDAVQRSGGDMNAAAGFIRQRWTGLEGLSNEQIINKLTIIAQSTSVEAQGRVSVEGAGAQQPTTAAGAEPGTQLANGIFRPITDNPNPGWDDWERAQRILQGLQGYTPQMSTAAGRRTELPQYIGALESALRPENIPFGATEEQIDKVKARLDELRKAYVDSRDPIAEMIRLERERTEVLTSQTPAQAAITQKMREYDQQFVDDPAKQQYNTPENRRSYEAAVITQMAQPVREQLQDTERAIMAQRRMTAAVAEGSVAVGQATNYERAFEIVRRQGIGSDEARAKAVDELRAKYDLLQRAQNNDAVTKSIEQRRVEIGLMEQEAATLGMGITAREQELAAIKAISDARNRPGGTDQAYVDAAAQSARQAVSVRQGLERQKAAYSEIENFGSQAFDRIGEAITQNLATGEKKAVKFKDVLRGVVSEMTQWLLKLALLNPLKNWLTGANLPTLADVGGILMGGGGGGVASGGVAASGITAVAGALGGGGGGGGGGLLSGIGSIASAIFGGGSSGTSSQGIFSRLFGGGGTSAAGSTAVTSGDGTLNSLTSLMSAGGLMIVPQGNGTSRDANAPAKEEGGIMVMGQKGLQAFNAYRQFAGTGDTGGFFSRLEANNPTSYINGTTSFSTGWSAADSFLNTPLISGTADAGINATGAVTNSAGYGSMAQNSIDAAGSASAAGVGTNGLTVGGAAVGVAGVAGGIYGIYSGIQKGGVGGGFQAAGGAATAGLSAAAMAGMAVPVYGWIAAAVLTIIGALLPGQKPSDRTGTYTYNTATGEESVGGLTGDRFSQETRDQAKTMSQGFKDLAATVGEKTGLGRAVEAQFRVGVGARDGLTFDLNNWHAQGALDEEGIGAVTKAATAYFLTLAGEQTTDPLMKQVIGSSGTGDIEKTFANIDWYQNTYRPLVMPNDYERGINDVRKKWQESIDKAKELTLPVDILVENREKEIRALQRKRDADVTTYDAELQARRAAPNGGLTGQAGADNARRKAAADSERERIDFEQKMSSLGLTGSERDDRLTQLVEAQKADWAVAERNYWRGETDRGFNIRNAADAPYMRLLNAQGAAGDVSATNIAERWSFENQAVQSLEQTRRSLEDLGVSATDISRIMVVAAQAIDAERTNLERTETRRLQDRDFTARDVREQPFLRLYSALGSQGDIAATNEGERAAFATDAEQSMLSLLRSMEDLGYSSDQMAAQMAVAARAIDVEWQNLARTQQRRGEDRDLNNRSVRETATLRLYSAMGAAGGVAATNEGERAAYETNATQSMVTLRRSMEDLGWSAEAIAEQMAIAAQAIDVERSNLQRVQARRLEDRYMQEQQVGQQPYVKLYGALAATGNVAAANESERVQFEAGATQSMINLRRSMEDLGWSADTIAGQLAIAAQAIDVERQNLGRAQARRAEDNAFQNLNVGQQPWLRYYAAAGAAGNIDAQNEADRVQFNTNASQSLATLRRSMEDLGWSAEAIANQIGIASYAIDVERDNLERTIARRTQDRAYAITDLRVGLDARYQRATGNNEAADAIAFEWQAQQDQLQLQRQMQDLGFSASETAARLEQFGAIVDAERENMAEQLQDQRAGTALGPISGLVDYATSLRYSDASPLSLQQQLESAQAAFNDTASKAAGGDYSSIQGLQSASDTYLGLARQVYGSGADYVDAFNKVTTALESVSGMSIEALTASVYIEEQRSSTQQLVDELQKLRTEVVNLRTETTQSTSAPTRVQDA